MSADHVKGMWTIDWPCDYCGVDAGRWCRTRSGAQTYKSHMDRQRSVALFQRYGIRSWGTDTLRLPALDAAVARAAVVSA